MPRFTNMAPEVAVVIAESERNLIRSWDLQRRGRAEPRAEPVSDEQVDAAASILEELVPHLPTDHQDDIRHLVQIVHTRLALKFEQS